MFIISDTPYSFYKYKVSKNFDLNSLQNMYDKFDRKYITLLDCRTMLLEEPNRTSMSINSKKKYMKNNDYKLNFYKFTELTTSTKSKYLDQLYIYLEKIEEEIKECKYMLKIRINDIKIKSGIQVKNIDTIIFNNEPKFRHNITICYVCGKQINYKDKKCEICKFNYYNKLCIIKNCSNYAINNNKKCIQHTYSVCIYPKYKKDVCSVKSKYNHILDKCCSLS